MHELSAAVRADARSPAQINEPVEVIAAELPSEDASGIPAWSTPSASANTVLADKKLEVTYQIVKEQCEAQYSRPFPDSDKPRNKNPTQNTGRITAEFG